MPRRKPISYAAGRDKRRRPARKEAAVSPTQEQIRIPPQLRLEHRHVCAPRQDERPLVRTRDGHVLAVVEAWRPDLAN